MAVPGPNMLVRIWEDLNTAYVLFMTSHGRPIYDIPYAFTMDCREEVRRTGVLIGLEEQVVQMHPATYAEYQAALAAANIPEPSGSVLATLLAFMEVLQRAECGPECRPSTSKETVH